ncbi:MAG: hypothetical protein ACOYIA_02510 [Eubacteriales bacterium]
MKESEYFDLLEVLGGLVRESVELVCRPSARPAGPDARCANKVRLADMADKADRLAGRIMKALASDFITPMEREDISAVALSLRRAVHAACTVPRISAAECRLEPAISCLKLAALIEKHTGVLRKINKKGPLPLPSAYFQAANIPPGTFVGQGAISRLYEHLCDACEAVIHAVMGNI